MTATETSIDNPTEHPPDMLLSIGVMEDGSFWGVVSQLKDNDIVCVCQNRGTSHAELVTWIETMIGNQPWETRQ